MELTAKMEVSEVNQFHGRPFFPNNFCSACSVCGTGFHTLSAADWSPGSDLFAHTKTCSVPAGAPKHVLYLQTEV